MVKVFLAPLSAGSLGKSVGTEMAPDEIMRVLSARFLNESGLGVQTQEAVIDMDPANLEASHEAIFEAVKGHSFRDPLFLLGGDHSVTYPSFRAFQERFPGSGLIVFDAHPDLQENFKPPSHEDYLRVLIEEGILAPERAVLVGVRSFSSQEKEFAESKKRQGMTVLDMKTLASDGLWDACDLIMEKARSWPRAYISIDVDVVDPSMAPGVAYPEPAGLTSRELLTVLHRLLKLPNIAAFDIVEAVPSKDVAGLTVSLAAKILHELLSYGR
ncbi:arginase family protein [Candidatus Woesearchaeota archaeon]|nr:MAG: arginase family protein [Candidatus Woesearchaeota archaeon]